jgi:hypothetical protein
MTEAEAIATWNARPDTDRIAALEAEVARLRRAFEEHGGRYWEARYRDEAAENAKLRRLLRDAWTDEEAIMDITWRDAARAALQETPDAG